MKKSIVILLFVVVPSLLWAGTWERIETYDNPTLSGQTCVYDESSGNIIMMGDAKLSDGNIYQLNLGSYEKHWIVSVTSDTVKRTGHTAVYDVVRNRMIVFGGNTDSFYNIGVTDTVFTFDSINTQWQVLPTTGTDIPSARTAHAAVFDPVYNRMIIFGGWDREEIILTNTYQLDLSVSPARWSKVMLTNEPYPRRQATAVYDSLRKRMVLFGGLTNEGNATDEILTLDLSKADINGQRWEKIIPAVSVSSGLARTAHVAVYNADEDCLLVFGGWSPVSLTKEFFNTTFSFGFQDRTWTRVLPGPDLPVARRNLGGVYDPIGKRFIVYGGASGSDLQAITYSDMYALSSQTSWSPSAEKEDVYNYPNPFNAHREKTFIKFYSEDAQEVKLRIYSLIGDLVKEYSVTSNRGINTVEWDGTNGNGKKVESGGYICIVEKNGERKTFKIAVVK